MTTTDKKKVALLGLLIALAVVSWFFVFRPIMMTASTTPAATEAKPGAKKATIKANQDGKLNLGGLDKPSTGDIGKRNLFQFPPKQPPRPNPLTTTAPPAFTPPTSVPIPTPITPPTPPFKTFKYEGVSVNRGTGKILGALSEGGNTYQVKEGDCLLGQYCVVRLTETAVELEDVQTNPKRRQEFRRTVQ